MNSLLSNDEVVVGRKGNVLGDVVLGDSVSLDSPVCDSASVEYFSEKERVLGLLKSTFGLLEQRDSQGVIRMRLVSVRGYLSISPFSL